MDARDDALAVLGWLVGMPAGEFLETYYAQKPLYVARNDSSFYDQVVAFDVQALEALLSEHEVPYGYNLDVTKVDSRGRRSDHNGEPGEIAKLSDVLAAYHNDGCSVRIVHPEKYDPPMLTLLARLQEAFRATMGANIYLTPAGTQGFAPHYDDVDVFVLQLSGAKIWRLHHAPDPASMDLARFSSPDFARGDLAPPFATHTLRRGDLLYLPRGMIHQALAAPDEDSCHITLSANQLNTWADLLKDALTLAVDGLAQESPELRAPLPLDLFDAFGAMHSDEDGHNPVRDAIRSSAASFLNTIVAALPLDVAVDQRAARFVHLSHPPLTEGSQLLTAIHAASRSRKFPMLAPHPALGLEPRTIPSSPATAIRLLTKYVCRMVLTEAEDEDSFVIYYNSNNPSELNVDPPSRMTLPLLMAPALEVLDNAYPDFVLLNDLPELDHDEALDFAQALYEARIVVVDDGSARS
ncbi:lysine-specific demethylase NO66 [Thecamonas trahens ATCC 50062]|uniref:Bifunctional lysine-specific demethylase and histidyl-hydroxylase n=1 Tax=Thecamonas trahens ATCC 50062 TaxID=461836 RepID=A0A0L0D869_THETB|nr:lysine-specific demethylase NO66 [Thecamonas trahens ATCC 50062]KNC48430.1 lysine-specific demethylase NO66 [Thecamonas trahens ATCC 50062]|eukprot:XP_013758545.1 lysine-specific demethylase NO66 [Thecamonas trahens ATCC 50062]